MPADARSLLRAQARALRADLAAAQSRSGYSPEAKAHLAEAISTLDEALKAPLDAAGRVSDAQRCWRRASRSRHDGPPSDRRAQRLARSARQPRARQPVRRRSTRTCARSRPRSTSRSRAAASTFTLAGDAGADGARGAGAASASTRSAEKPLSVDDIQLGLIELSAQHGASARRPPTTRRRRCARGAPTCTAARRNQTRLPARHPGARHHLRHRAGRHRQDLPRGRLRGRRARARRGEAHRAGAPGGRGRRAAGLPARRPRAEGRSRTCARSTTRSTT